MTNAEKKKAARCKDLSGKLKVAQREAAHKQNQLDRANAAAAKWQERLDALGCV